MTTASSQSRLVAVAIGSALALSALAALPAHAATLSNDQVNAIIGLLVSFGADSATIANVQASLTGSTAGSTSSSGGTTSTGSGAVSTGGGASSSAGGVACAYSRAIVLGASGPDVLCLQKWLMAHGQVLSSGATGYYGLQTKAAIIAWQRSAGLPATGYFGTLSARAALGSGTTGGTHLPTSSVDSVLQGLDSDLSHVDGAGSQDDSE